MQVHSEEVTIIAELFCALVASFVAVSDRNAALVAPVLAPVGSTVLLDDAEAASSTKCNERFREILASFAAGEATSAVGPGQLGVRAFTQTSAVHS